MNPKEFEFQLLNRMCNILRERSILPDRLLSDHNYILSLAQHCGAPTRLLDWTKSSLVASYFAASDALRLRSTEFSVFAMATVALHRYYGNECSLIEPQTGFNENLFAQSGVLVRHDWAVPDFWRPELNNVLRGSPEVSALVDSRMIRFDVPASEAPDVFSELYRRGVDCGTAFPGVHGLVGAAVDYVRAMLVGRI